MRNDVIFALVSVLLSYTTIQGIIELVADFMNDVKFALACVSVNYHISRHHRVSG